MTQEKAKRPRGTGRIYQPKGSRFLWVQFYVNGKPYRQSTGTTENRKAEKFLAQKLGEVTTQTFVAPKRVTVAELYADMEQDYRNQKYRSLYDLQKRWELHLEPFFGTMRASDIGEGLINRYIAKRQDENAGNATINRELAVLRRCFSIAVKGKEKKIPAASVPIFPHLSEPHPRRGFLTDAQVDALCSACAGVGLWLRAMLEVGRQCGCRVGELKGMRVGQIDLDARTIRFEKTKNGEDRTVVMTTEMLTLIEQCITGKVPTDFVFTRDDGKEIRDFRGSWTNVCKEAGVPGLLFHDLRRTGVRNMIRRGISQKVATLISGHKTASVFDRYNIIDHSDLEDAAKKMEEGDFRARTGKMDPALKVVGGRAVQ